jgi:hypothetical protein
MKAELFGDELQLGRAGAAAKIVPLDPPFLRVLCALRGKFAFPFQQAQSQTGMLPFRLGGIHSRLFMSTRR